MRFFDNLAEEILLKIFNTVALSDAANLACVDKKFNRIANDPYSNLAIAKKEKNLLKMLTQSGYPIGKYSLLLKNVKAPGTPFDYTLSLLQGSEQKDILHLFDKDLAQILNAAKKGPSNLIQVLNLLGEEGICIANLLEGDKSNESQMKLN